MTPLLVTDVTEAVRDLMRASEASRKAAGGGLYRFGEMVMTDSKANYVPVDLGPLRASGHVELPVYEGNEVSVTLGFGGVAEAYALVQHEDLYWDKSTHALVPKKLQHTVGGSKYLERPMLQHAPAMPVFIAGEVSSALRGRG